ncbi:MAG: type II secretion system protein, partial [Planctomycetota bacterium]
MKKNAFTLVELLIVVTILSIMAAIVVPTFRGNVAQARESASKTNLVSLRNQIQLYKLHHKGVTPGYTDGSPITAPLCELQLTATTTINGAISPSTTPVDPYFYGPYFKKIPPNPYNKLSNIVYVAEATVFSIAADGTTSGWLYKKETGEIVLNQPGTDSEGVAY